MKLLQTLFITLFFVFTSNLLAQEEVPKVEKETRNIEAAWSKEYNIKTGTTFFHKDAHHAYTIPVYTDDAKYVQKWMARYLKETSGGKSKKRKKGVMVHSTSVPDIHPSANYDIHYKTETGTETRSIVLSAAFVADGDALSADNDQEAHEKALGFMREIYQRLNEDIVQGQIEGQQAVLDDLEKQMTNLKKDHEKLEKDLSKAKDALSNAETELRYVEAEIGAQQSIIKAKEEANAKELSADDMKALSKMRSDMASLEGKKGKLMEEINEEKMTITELEADLPKNEAAQQRLAEKIEKERESLEYYREKLRQVK